jgi:hypothetical protein
MLPKFPCYSKNYHIDLAGGQFWGRAALAPVVLLRDPGALLCSRRRPDSLRVHQSLILGSGVSLLWCAMAPRVCGAVLRLPTHSAVRPPFATFPPATASHVRLIGGTLSGVAEPQGGSWLEREFWKLAMKRLIRKCCVPSSLCWSISGRGGALRARQLHPLLTRLQRPMRARSRSSR